MDLNVWKYSGFYSSSHSYPVDVLLVSLPRLTQIVLVLAVMLYAVARLRCGQNCLAMPNLDSSNICSRRILSGVHFGKSSEAENIQAFLFNEYLVRGR